jgi:steroid Delta-isomerase
VSAVLNSERSQRYRELILGYYDAVDQGSVEGVLKVFAPDATYHRPGYADMRDATQIEAFYRSKRRIVEGRHKVDRLVVDDDDVAVFGTFCGVLRDGARVDIGFADFFLLNSNGLVAQRRTFFDAPLV